jgi:hypothetical protein
LIRRPTAAASELTVDEMTSAADNLQVRLSRTGDRPLIVFRYVKALELAGNHLIGLGYDVLRVPHPYERAQSAEELMQKLKGALGIV